MCQKMNLIELARQYGCDKYYSHSYVEFYQELFSSMKIKRLLEIGIGFEDLMKPFVPFYIHGASLKMFRDYLPEASIFGCDIREDALFFDERIWTLLCDQSNPDSLLHMMLHILGGRLDVIIDDGSHVTDHQIISAKTLLPYVNTGGVYIVEDCQEPLAIISELGEGEIHEFGKRADDCLVLIRR